MKLKSGSFGAAPTLSARSYRGYRNRVLGPVPMHGPLPKPQLCSHISCNASTPKRSPIYSQALQHRDTSAQPVCTPSSQQHACKARCQLDTQLCAQLPPFQQCNFSPKIHPILLCSPPKSGPGFLTNPREVGTGSSQPFIPAAICSACQISALHGDGDLPRALLWGDKSRDAPGGSNHRTDARKQL